MFDEGFEERVRTFDRKIMVLWHLKSAFKFTTNLHQVYPKVKVSCSLNGGYGSLLWLVANKEFTKYSVQAGDNAGLIKVEVPTRLAASSCVLTFSTIKDAATAFNWFSNSSLFKGQLFGWDECVLTFPTISDMSSLNIAEYISKKFLANNYLNSANSITRGTCWSSKYDRESLDKASKHYQERFNQLLGSKDESLFWLLFDAQLI